MKTKTEFIKNLTQSDEDTLPSDTEAALVILFIIITLSSFYPKNAGIVQAYFITSIFFFYLYIRKISIFLIKLIKSENSKAKNIFVGLLVFLPIDFFIGIGINILLTTLWQELNML